MLIHNVSSEGEKCYYLRYKLFVQNLLELSGRNKHGGPAGRFENFNTLSMRRGRLLYYVVKYLFSSSSNKFGTI